LIVATTDAHHSTKWSVEDHVIPSAEYWYCRWIGQHVLIGILQERNYGLAGARAHARFQILLPLLKYKLICFGQWNEKDIGQTSKIEYHWNESSVLFSRIKCGCTMEDLAGTWKNCSRSPSL
jgi:hypothetical protein